MTDSASPPIAQIVDLLGRKWLMRVIWELRDGPLTFRALREACGGVSPTVLNTRVADLAEHGLLEKSDAGYQLTALGEELLTVYEPLSAWAKRWVSKTGGLR